MGFSCFSAVVAAGPVGVGSALRQEIRVVDGSIQSGTIKEAVTASLVKYARKPPVFSATAPRYDVLTSEHECAVLLTKERLYCYQEI